MAGHRYTRSDTRALMQALRGGYPLPGGGTAKPVSLKLACQAAGLNYANVQAKMKRDPGFKKAIDTARARRRALVEDALMRMATEQGEKGWTSANLGAAQFILTNEDRETWSMRPEASGEDSVDAEVKRRANEITDEVRAALKERAPEAILGPGSEEAQ